jgi:hypothetical protein
MSLAASNTYASSNYMNKISCFSNLSRVPFHLPGCNLRAFSAPFVALYSRLLHENYSFHELFQRPSMNIPRSRPANKIITTWLQREGRARMAHRAAPPNTALFPFPNSSLKVHNVQLTGRIWKDLKVPTCQLCSSNCVSF